MRPWRDVIKASTFTKLIEQKMGTTTARVGKLTQLKGVFDRNLSSPEAFLYHIADKLSSYHGLHKGELKMIDPRIKALKELSQLATRYLTEFKVDMAHAAMRNTNAEGGVDNNLKHKFLGSHQSGKPMDETIDRNMLTLARRSLRKAAYLGQLKKYYSKGGAGFRWRDAQELLNYVRSPQEDDGKSMGLTPGVRMEQVDFAHRGDFEETSVEKSCGWTFEIWAKSAQHQQTPFFLWLEMTSVCVEEDKSLIAGTQSVAYDRADLQQATPGNSVKLVIPGSPVMEMDLANMGNGPMTCDTSTYKCAGSKDPLEQWGDGVAAFVWTKEGELFIARHEGLVYHHSSFISGGRVRCAGMIIIKNGVVTAISNHSGHYHPGKDKVFNFVRFLIGHSALAADARLRISLGGGRSWKGTPAEFLQQYAMIV